MSFVSCLEYAGLLSPYSRYEYFYKVLLVYVHGVQEADTLCTCGIRVLLNTSSAKPTTEYTPVLTPHCRFMSYKLYILYTSRPTFSQADRPCTIGWRFAPSHDWSLLAFSGANQRQVHLQNEDPTHEYGTPYGIYEFVDENSSQTLARLIYPTSQQ